MLMQKRTMNILSTFGLSHVSKLRCMCFSAKKESLFAESVTERENENIPVFQGKLMVCDTILFSDILPGVVTE